MLPLRLWPSCLARWPCIGAKAQGCTRPPGISGPAPWPCWRCHLSASTAFAVIGPFSPLHGLALFTLWSLYEGIRRAQAGEIAIHRRVFRSLYWFGVMIAGLFNFLPGRTINRALLPESPELGYALIALGLAVAAVAVIRPYAGRLRRLVTIWS